jgi:hypothetical protein
MGRSEGFLRVASDEMQARPQLKPVWVGVEDD